MGYRTVAGFGQDEHVEKKSRFIGLCWPVYTEEEAKAKIEQIRKEYWDASHHVYAYRLQPSEKTPSEIQKFTDDGEPGGTAGKPCLDVLLGAGVTNVLVIVIRYFGGTLLGTGGLVRAYTKGAQIALTAAGIVDKKNYLSGYIDMDYGILAKIQYTIGSMGREDVSETGTVYEDKVRMHLLVREEYLPQLEKKLAEASDGRLSLIKEEKVLAALVDGRLQSFKY